MGKELSDEEYNNKCYQERLLAVQEEELKLKKFANPLLVAVIALFGVIYGNYLINKDNENKTTILIKKHCYTIIQDIMRMTVAERNEAAKELKMILSSDIVSDCGGDLSEIADLYSTEKVKIEVTPEPTAICEKIVSIKSLGWSHGHKTNFCIAKGYDGIHNPFGDYSSGGFCFKGDSKACIADMNK